MLVMDYPLKELAPADYNPRKISDEAFEKLKESIKVLGIIKPIILNGENKILTAGHQRTKAMKAIGITSAPAVLLPALHIKDEIMFNLLHNKVEVNQSVVYIKGIANLPYGYSTVSSEVIDVKERGKGMYAKEISRLILKYGEWGSVVVDYKGRVIDNSDYAQCCKTLNKPLLLYKLTKEQTEYYMEVLKHEFGVYNYDALDIKSYNQVNCQMNKGTTGSYYKAPLYEKGVFANIKKSDRLVDFGAGRCAYAMKLRLNGYKAFMYEPHFRDEGKSTELDIKSVVTMIKEIEADVKQNGLYDIVVLDSVLNSVVNDDFEKMVLTTCNALLDSKGDFYCSTRAIEGITRLENADKSHSKRSGLQFLDSNGYAVRFAHSMWTLQKFQTKEDFIKMLHKYFEDVDISISDSSTHRAICRKPKKLPMKQYIESLNTEFNMEYPNGYRHNKHKKLVAEILRRVEER